MFGLKVNNLTVSDVPMAVVYRYANVNGRKFGQDQRDTSRNKTICVCSHRSAELQDPGLTTLRRKSTSTTVAIVTFKSDKRVRVKVKYITVLN